MVAMGVATHGFVVQRQSAKKDHIVYLCGIRLPSHCDTEAVGDAQRIVNHYTGSALTGSCGLLANGCWFFTWTVFLPS
jgi:hypothetical protein